MILRDSIKFKEQGKQRFKIIDYKAPVFLISDNPVLLPKIPHDINDFSNSLIFPISKNRVLVMLKEGRYRFDENAIKMTNFLLMCQADRFIGFHDKKMLHDFVIGYRQFKKIGSYTEVVKQRLFAKINEKVET